MKPKVLLVDDYPGVRDSLRNALGLEGYDVTLATNGRETVNALRNTRFDIVLLDLETPAVQAWNTWGQIVTVSLALPIIIIAGQSDQHWLAAQKGVAGVLLKPLDLPALLEVMRRATAEKVEECLQGFETGCSAKDPIQHDRSVVPTNPYGSHEKN